VVSTNKILGVVQARYSSVRLPGKVLLELSGQTILGWVIQKLTCCSLISQIVIATSADSSDDPIVAFCNARGLNCFRGSLNNVALRFSDVLETFQSDAFLRISADSPMIDPLIVDAAIRKFLAGKYDLVTNVQKRTFPKGQSVEVLHADTFKKVAKMLQSPYDQEHVTSYYYRNPARFRIHNIESENKCGHLQLSVDTMEDYLRMTDLLSRVDPVNTTWEALASELQKYLDAEESLGSKSVRV
jgi:spore coat polysaccharide biosynthesis protein SpsF